ncbi:hypothetical protein B0H17DRAFT_1203985 [Mycena rosella]|uniref:Uncharacterized protein n=1 Tax=Mycena rosella TaxID=1033263 RepID=A0AAD7DDG2_MYCRO|nr:hypothetical protein B0H17DRAFT_1203985 [Mycena rosella]
MLDSIDVMWGEFEWMPADGDVQMEIILPAVLGAFNLCFSIYGAAAAFKSRSAKEYDMLLACVVTTGCVNMVAAYMRRNVADNWFGWAFTMTLMLDSILNLSTAFRILRAYPTRDRHALPRYAPGASIHIPVQYNKPQPVVDHKPAVQYMPAAQSQEEAEANDFVWIDEKGYPA